MNFQILMVQFSIFLAAKQPENLNLNFKLKLLSSAAA